MSGDERNRVLAEIISSDTVGGIHLQRVGEILIAHERVNTQALHQKAGGASPKRPAIDIDAIERALELEDRYCEVWRMCQERGREWRLAEGLHLLEQSLRETAEHLTGMALRDA
ncbi:hypothetical protein Caci_3713 [Catenulispora acidiphila DSM 44928]|uniref:Uncharacterized protein n=1 Tax=Catenulispora acidiphila (strain DSM 44928 / JCM 14897 / NBRC 102108 / NRRL B-24433 / ID139908) TaxID=479433 RepID=C7QBZ6_CATAD|nr:hypothetical protein [Catenulispora acidiphila]ACU72615.1 hypothetical protein Caci_3713 [Catenulispora acidiphila DSM 44928]